MFIFLCKNILSIATQTLQIDDSELNVTGSKKERQNPRWNMLYYDKVFYYAKNNAFQKNINFKKGKLQVYVRSAIYNSG